MWTACGVVPGNAKNISEERAKIMQWIIADNPSILTQAARL